MYNFNIILTTLCNANCSHCYMKTNENARTLSFEQIDMLINKLPINTKTIVLTGGEIFLVLEELNYILNKINNKFDKVRIGLESNGIYLYTHNTLEILMQLKKMNVDFIRFSDDYFHENAGINLFEVRNIKKLESNNTPLIKYLVQDKALSLGNAEQLTEEEKSRPYCMNNLNSEKNPYIFMNIDGDAYLCAWKSGPKIGNFFTDDFTTIEKNMKNPVSNYILTGNILDAMAKFGNYDKEFLKKQIENDGECNVCIKTFIKRRF